MSILLCMLVAVFIGVAAWGFNAVMAELAKWHPSEPLDTMARRFEVDQFIWSRRAPPELRKQYVATQACAIPASLCLAGLVWLNEPRPNFRALGTTAFCALAVFAGALLLWKTLRSPGD